MTTVGDAFVDKQYGEPFTYDPEFTGPVKSRSCTDIICLFLFLAFIAGWAVVAGFAYKEGNPELLLHPTDTYGNVCGLGNFTNRKYLFFFDLTTCIHRSVLTKGCPTPQVCVEKCPSKTVSVFTTGDKSNLICKYNIDSTTIDKTSAQDLARDGRCAEYYLQSEPVADRCLPVNLSIINGSKIRGDDGEFLQFLNGTEILTSALGEGGSFLAQFLNAREVGERIFQDFSSAWVVIILFLLASMVVSFLWIVLMRFIAGFMVYLSMILVIGVLGFASAYSLYTYYYLETGQTPNAIFTNEFVENLNTYSSAKKTWLAVGIVFGIIWLIVILMLIFLRKRINLAVALIKEGSKAVGCIMSSLFFPLVPYAFQLIVLVFWGSTALCIASAGRAQYQNIDDNNHSEPCEQKENIVGSTSCMFTNYLKDDNLSRAQIYNLFGLFWAMFFVVGVGQVSLAGAFASYYWARNKPSDVPTFAVLSSLGICFRYHLGSVAFGSLIIAIIRMIRVALEYIDRKCKKYDNPFTKCVILCCKCCFWCLEKFMRFISKNAYIMMAVYGKNFCSSAREAFKLLMRNVVRVVVLDKVTDYLLLLGKLVIVGLTAIAAFFFFSGKVQYLKNHSPELNYYFLPVITVTIGAYLIATGFFNVYSMAVDTLFLSFLEDCERNDGSPERPYRMSKELMKILGKKNKLQDASH